MLVCTNCGAAVSIQRRNVPLPPPPFACQSCGVHLRLGMTPIGVGLLALLGLFGLSIMLAIWGTISLSFLNLPIVVAILLPMVCCFWRWGVVLKRK